jgi:hypothetical protein
LEVGVTVVVCLWRIFAVGIEGRFNRPQMLWLVRRRHDIQHKDIQYNDTWHNDNVHKINIMNTRLSSRVLLC